MRSIKEFNIGPLKCTVLFHNEKYTLRIEDVHGEVNYKLGQLDGLNLEELEKVFQHPELKTHLANAFLNMRKGRDFVADYFSETSEEQFEEII